MGKVIAEYNKGGTGPHIIICDMGSYGQQCHLLDEQCRVANGLEVRIVGSHDGKGYGWKKRFVNMEPRHAAHPQGTKNEANNGDDVVKGQGSDTILIGTGTPTHAEVPTQLTTVLSGRQDREVPDYHEEGEYKDSKASTGRTPHPKVRSFMPGYLLGEGSQAQATELADSSGDEWLGSFEDFDAMDSDIHSESGQNHDDLQAGNDSVEDVGVDEPSLENVDLAFEVWLQSEESYKARDLD